MIDEGKLIHSLKEKLGMRQLIGESPAFLEQTRKIPRIAGCDATVLISGETGTGKELVARAIHYLGTRADKPFMPVNCGAIPAELVENELFGHIKGGYTGADLSQQGLIREAEGGTIFLDEIDCLPLLAQVKLLRFLQEKEYRQIGSPKIQKADVRIIAATNLKAETAVSEGRIRKDLFYRLNIVPFSLPPLRERKKDIELLTHHFLQKYNSEFGKEVSGFTPEALQKLFIYEWPGNVRELENVIERAVIFSSGSLIEDREIVLAGCDVREGKESFQTAKARVIAEFEKNYIHGLLLAYEGNISRAARAADKNRRAFWELMRKHKIEANDVKHI